MQKFGKINTKKLYDEVHDLEKELITTSAETKKIEILDKLLSYNKLLYFITKEYESFDKKYYMYLKYIEKLVERTNNIYGNIAKYIKDNKTLFRMTSKHVDSFFDNASLLEKDFDLKEISRNDIFDILNDVFDEEFTNFLNKEFKNGRVHFNTCSSPNAIKYDYNGTCIDIDNYMYYVIEKDKKYYYYNLFSIVHEISHGYIQKKYNKDFIDDPFREVFTIYNELVLCKYLFDKNIAIKDCKLNDTFFFETLKDNCNSLYFWSYLIDSVNEDSYVDENDFENIIKNEKFLLKKLLNSNIDERDYFGTLIYSLGRIVALEQYYKYIQDPEKSKYLFKKIHSSNNYISIGDRLKNLEIEKIDFVTCKSIKKYYDEYQKRYVKSKM